MRVSAVPREPAPPERRALTSGTDRSYALVVTETSLPATGKCLNDRQSQPRHEHPAREPEVTEPTGAIPVRIPAPPTAPRPATPPPANAEGRQHAASGSNRAECSSRSTGRKPTDPSETKFPWGCGQHWLGPVKNRPPACRRRCGHHHRQVPSSTPCSTALGAYRRAYAANAH